MIIRKYKLGLVVIGILILFSYYRLITNIYPHHGSYRKVMDISAKQVIETKDFRKYIIRIKNEEPNEIAIVSVLVSYISKPQVKYPVKVEAKSLPKEKILLKPGETCDFEAYFPKLMDLENHPNINKDSIEVEVKAAVVTPDDKPGFIYIGGEPSPL